MKTKFLILIILTLLLISCNKNSQEQLTAKAIQEQANENPNLIIEGPFIVTRVIDGDTIEINNSYKIRLSGINTPEIGECYYQEAKEFLSKLTLELQTLQRLIRLFSKLFCLL